MKKHFSLSFKILALMGIFAITAFAVGGFGLYQMRVLSSDVQDLVHNGLRVVDLSHSLRDKQRDVVVLTKVLLLEKEVAKRSEFSAQIEEKIKEWNSIFSELQASASPSIQEALNEYQLSFNDFSKAESEARALAVQGNDAEAITTNQEKVEPLRMKSLEALSRVTTEVSGQFHTTAKHTESRYDEGFTLVLLMLVGSNLLAGACVFPVIRKLTRSINKILSALTGSSDYVSTASVQIASSSEKISSAATQQAASLQQTSAAAQELASMVMRNLDTANRTATISQNSHASATKGQNVINEMIRAIEDINSSNGEISSEIEDNNRKIGEVVKVIAEIGEKTKVINDIVFQTKILSFNASVEAARAGDHGKGFAVVAEEIGNLANMSGSAAREIDSMLEDSRRKVESIVMETRSKVESLVNRGKQKVSVGINVAKECGDVLNEIVNNVTAVNQMTGDITIASQEQSTGVQEITRAMQQLDQVTQVHSFASDETAQTAEVLSEQATSLKHTVEDLIVAIRGNVRKSHHALVPIPVKGSTSNGETNHHQMPTDSKTETKRKKNVVSIQGSKTKNKALATSNKSTKPKPASPAPKESNTAKADKNTLVVPDENDPRFKEI